MRAVLWALATGVSLRSPDLVADGDVQILRDLRALDDPAPNASNASEPEIPGGNLWGESPPDFGLGDLPEPDPLATAAPRALTRTAVTARFEAWCDNATAYLTREVNAFASDHSEAEGQVAAAANESRAVNALFAHLARAALPTSTEPDAGIDAAQRFAEAQQSPEYQALLARRVAAVVGAGDAEAAFHDSEILARTFGDLLGAALRACRAEEHLDAAVAQALQPATPPPVLPGSALVTVARDARDAPLTESKEDAPFAAARKVLEERRARLEDRAQECLHLRAGQERTTEHERLSDANAAAAAEAHEARASGDASLLAEFRAVDRGVHDLEAQAEPIFEDEQVVYAAEVTEDGGGAKAALLGRRSLPVRIAGGIAEKRVSMEMDATHRFWGQWRDSLRKAFTQVREYLSKRLTQLREAGLRHEYLRAARSPEATHRKSPAPVGLDCPSEKEQAKQLEEVEKAIREVSNLQLSASAPRHN